MSTPSLESCSIHMTVNISNKSLIIKIVIVVKVQPWTEMKHQKNCGSSAPVIILISSTFNNNHYYSKKSVTLNSKFTFNLTSGPFVVSNCESWNLNDLKILLFKNLPLKLKEENWGLNNFYALTLAFMVDGL